MNIEGVFLKRNKKVQNKQRGECALLKTQGVFVKSHLIPRALTLMPKEGGRRIEAGLDMYTRPKRRYDSWFDLSLCIDAGEKILSDIDNKGIKILREYQLIWSSWSGSSLKHNDFIPCSDNGEGLRVIIWEKKTAEELQLFFLSLLWRAGATKIPEFDTVQLSEKILEDLRLKIIQQKIGTFEDYPVMLFPIITKGDIHNTTPIIEQHDDFPLLDINKRFFIRFYFDGLIAHVFLPSEQNTILEEGLRPFLLGLDERMVLSCKIFSNTREKEHMVRILDVHNRD